MYPELRQIGPFPLESVAFRIDPATFEYHANIVQIEEWELATRQDFDPPITTSLDCQIEITCPRCATTKGVPLLVPLASVPAGESGDGETAPDQAEKLYGTGYAQAGFRADCLSCGLVITRSVFSANNIARDISRASSAILEGRLTFLK